MQLRASSKFILIIFVSLVVGCARSGDDGPNNGDQTIRDGPASSPGDLYGSWISSCMDAHEAGIGELSALELSGSQFKRVSRVGASGSCASYFFEATFSGTFTVGEPNEKQISFIDLSTVTALVKPTTSQGARALSLARVCGISSWEVGVERDVLAHLGEPGCFERYPRTMYSAFKVESFELFFALAEVFSEIERRPTLVPTTFPYRKALSIRKPGDFHARLSPER